MVVYDPWVMTKVGLLACAVIVSTATAQPRPPRPPDKPVPKRIDPPATAPQAIGVGVPIIEVLDPSGTMTAPFVRTALMKVEPELMKCADASKWQSAALVWIVTDWRGKVTKLELAVDSAAVEKCFAKVLKTIVVKSAQVRATAFVKLTVGVPASAPMSDDPLDTIH